MWTSSRPHAQQCKGRREVMVIRKYAIIPEPHIWDKNISSRKDYVGEIKCYMRETREHILALKEQCDHLTLIWIGDIFHKNFTNMDEFGFWLMWFLETRAMVDEQYSVIGNHEISYYRDNPFWHLVSNLEAPSLSAMSGKTIHPRGKQPIIRVVDKISDGKWDIYLNHFGIFHQPDKPTNNIGLFHSSIIEDEIARTLREKYNRDPLEHFIDHSYIRRTSPFFNYDYADVGHMHRAFGLFTLEYPNGSSTRLRYLGSTGRTNSKEVDDNDLDRVLPVYTIVDGDTLTFEEIPMRLWSRLESINETKVKEQTEKSEKLAEKREYRRSTTLLEDPMYQMRETFKSIEGALTLIDSATQQTTPNFLKELIEKRFY